MGEPLHERSDSAPAEAQLSGPARAPKADRYRQAAALLRQWMAEDDGYDDAIWPLVNEELEGLRMRCRE